MIGAFMAMDDRRRREEVRRHAWAAAFSATLTTMSREFPDLSAVGLASMATVGGHHVSQRAAAVLEENAWLAGEAIKGARRPWWKI